MCEPKAIELTPNKNTTTTTTIFQREDIMDMILPKKGDYRPQGLPIWEEERQMFIMDDHESKGGNRSYKGVRVTDRFMTVEYIGNYHTLTYINALELYIYDGKELKLASKREFDKRFYDKVKNQKEFENMFCDFVRSQAKMLNQHLTEDQVTEHSRTLVESSYCSMTDENTSRLLELAQPMLPKNNYYIEY